MSEVFEAGNGTPANFDAGQVRLSINGQLKNERYTVGGMTVGQFIQQVAQQNGIKTFSVYADGNKLTTDDAKTLASEFEEIDIVAKDSRG